jgi:enolase-phosphatase E1
MTYILTDIEGTTTSISFVHDVLFPYSQKRIKDFVLSNIDSSDVKTALAQTRETAKQEDKKENISNDEACDYLLKWIKEDRKHPALKALQGHIWQEGYEKGEVVAHVYNDVPAALKKWQEQGHTIGVYSSGSVKAQHLLFQYSEAGNMLHYFSNHFDTKVGHKREANSYVEISTQLGIPPASILFLSDIKEELDAAKIAGMRTIQLVRQDDVIVGDHPTAKSFAEIRP